MIRRAYERLFAAFYGWSLKVDGRQNGDNVYSAALSLSLALMFNVFTLVMIIDLLSPVAFLVPATHVSKAWWVLGIVAFAVSHYFYFRRGNRYRKVIAAYGPTEQDLAKGPHWKLIAYMALSFVALAGILVLRLE